MKVEAEAEIVLMKISHVLNLLSPLKGLKVRTFWIKSTSNLTKMES